MCTDSASVVIRNHDGLVQAAATRRFDDMSDVLTVVAMAEMEGHELAMECGFDRVVLETYCRALKTLLHDCLCLRSSIGEIVLRSQS